MLELFITLAAAIAHYVGWITNDAFFIGIIILYGIIRITDVLRNG